MSRLTIWRLATLVAIVGLWELIGRIGLVDPFWISSPSAICSRFLLSMQKGELPFHVGVTLSEAGAGLGAGAVSGVALGLILGTMPFVGAVLEPFIIALNSLPRVALGPLIVMFCGIGFASKFILALSLVIVPMMISTYESIKTIDPTLVNLMKIQRATRGQYFVKLILPNSIPWIFSALRVSISFAIIGAIVGELLSSKAGIGFMIDEAAGNFDSAGIMMPLVVLMLIAFSVDRFFLVLSNRLLRWRAVHA